MSNTCDRCAGRPYTPTSNVLCRACWVHEDFDEWSELTKERDAYRADAEAEWHRNPYA